MFVVLLHYPQPDAIEPYRAGHAEWVRENAACGAFLLTGPMLPRTGGVILANFDSRAELDQVLAKDPFREAGAEYTVIAFEPRYGRADFISPKSR